MNKVIINGRITSDPMYQTRGDTHVLKTRIANDRYYRSNGETIQKANFFNVTMFGKQAEFMAKHLTKGRKILVEGRLENDNWTDESGNTRYNERIVADSVEFEDYKKKDESARNEELSIDREPNKQEALKEDDLPF